MAGVNIFFRNNEIMASINIQYQISNVGKEKCSTCHFKLLSVMFLFLLSPWDVKNLEEMCVHS